MYLVSHIPESIIDSVINRIRKGTEIAFIAQSAFLSQRYEAIYQRALSWTMVATGETKSKLFKKEKMFTVTTKMFSVGYNPTSNNQSFSQEFDVNDNVHTRKLEHYRNQDRKNPKCSVRPVNIYAMFGRRYGVNRSARRRALALAIEKSLNTRVSHAYKYGDLYRYEPDLTSIRSKLSTITRAVMNNV